jgi:hypothetical protein
MSFSFQNQVIKDFVAMEECEVYNYQKKKEEGKSREIPIRIRIELVTVGILVLAKFSSLI